jgi:hypothetical protein
MKRKSHIHLLLQGFQRKLHMLVYLRTGRGQAECQYALHEALCNDTVGVRLKTLSNDTVGVRLKSLSNDTVGMRLKALSNDTVGGRLKA